MGFCACSALMAGSLRAGGRMAAMTRRKTACSALMAGSLRAGQTVAIMYDCPIHLAVPSWRAVSVPESQVMVLLSTFSSRRLSGTPHRSSPCIGHGCGCQDTTPNSMVTLQLTFCCRRRASCDPPGPHNQSNPAMRGPCCHGIRLPHSTSCDIAHEKGSFWPGHRLSLPLPTRHRYKTGGTRTRHRSRYCVAALVSSRLRSCD